jgi:hypothetical protein
MNWDLTNIGGVDGLLSTFAFGLAIDDALHDSTKTQLKASVTADQWDALEPALFGAGWHHGGASIDGSEYSDGGFGFGYEIDANGAVEFDGSGQPTYVPGDQISATRNGAYVLQNTMFLLAE